MSRGGGQKFPPETKKIRGGGWLGPHIPTRVHLCPILFQRECTGIPAKEWDCKNDLKLCKYDNPKVKLSLLPVIHSFNILQWIPDKWIHSISAWNVVLKLILKCMTVVMLSHWSAQKESCLDVRSFKGLSTIYENLILNI